MSKFSQGNNLTPSYIGRGYVLVVRVDTQKFTHPWGLVQNHRRTFDIIGREVVQRGEKTVG